MLKSVSLFTYLVTFSVAALSNESNLDKFEIEEKKTEEILSKLDFETRSQIEQSCATAVALYDKCHHAAERIKTDKQYEFSVMQSAKLPVEVKKAREESQKYSKTYLLTDREFTETLMIDIRKDAQFNPDLVSRGISLNQNVCFYGVNGSYHGAYEVEKAYTQCVVVAQNLVGPKKK